MNYTILIVDDDMAINDMLVKYLRKNGYITYSAYSGTEALLFLEKQKVNLIILDLMLPGLSGEQVLAEIKKTKNGNELIFAIQGRLDTTTAPQFEAELKQNIEGAETLILDLVDLEYLSSAGLRVFLTAQKIMNKQGEMIVRNANETISEIFEVTGFSDILTIE